MFEEMFIGNVYAASNLEAADSIAVSSKLSIRNLRWYGLTHMSRKRTLSGSKLRYIRDIEFRPLDTDKIGQQFLPIYDRVDVVMYVARVKHKDVR